MYLLYSKNIPASPAGTITSEASYAYENDTTFNLSSPVSVSERESFCFETVNLRAQHNALKEEVDMLNLKIPFNYVGIKGDSGKCHLLTEVASVMRNNLITYVRDFCEEDPNFELYREDQLIITLIKSTILHSNFWRILVMLGNLLPMIIFGNGYFTFLSAILGKHGGQSANILDNTTGF